jgi:hypothetical protein
MAISSVCACGAEIEAPDELAGQSVKCPQCAASVAIPGSAGGQQAPAREESHRENGAAPGVPKEAPRADNYREDGEVPADLKEKILADVNANEKVVWVAQPVQALILRRSMGWLIGGAAVALLGLLFMMGGLLSKAPQPAPGRPAPPPQATGGFFGSISTIMLIGGLCCAAVPLYRWKMAQGTCYALTNRRALVYKQGLFSPTRESYAPSEVADMRRAESWLMNGGGDLIFRTVKTISTSYSQGRSSSSVSTTHYGFLAIAHVKEIDKLVRETIIDRFVDKLAQANAL